MDCVQEEEDELNQEKKIAKESSVGVLKSISNALLPTSWISVSEEGTHESKLSVSEQLSALRLEKEEKVKRYERRSNIMTSSKQIEDIGLSFFENLNKVLHDQETLMDYLSKGDMNIERTNKSEQEEYVSIKIALQKRSMEVYAMKRQSFGSEIS